MPVLGITGGVATGKSTFVRALLPHLPPAELFDSDACAHELLDNEPGVRERVRRSFGDEVFTVEGVPDRARLRAIVFSDDARRRELEGILHPAIRAHWTARAEAAIASGAWLCVDIPLLYETGAESDFDRVIVVACSPAIQRHRLCQERGLDAAMADRIIAAQLDLSTKISKADHLIWNDTTIEHLDRQSALLAGWLRQRHG